MQSAKTYSKMVSLTMMPGFTTRGRINTGSCQTIITYMKAAPEFFTDVYRVPFEPQRTYARGPATSKPCPAIRVHTPVYILSQIQEHCRLYAVDAGWFVIDAFAMNRCGPTSVIPRCCPHPRITDRSHPTCRSFIEMLPSLWTNQI